MTIKTIIYNVAKKDGTYPLKIRISYKTDSLYIPLNISVAKNEWNASTQTIISRKDKNALNAIISQKMLELKSRLLPQCHRGMTFEELRYMISGSCDDGDSDYDFITKFIALKSGRTKELYQQTLDKLTDYCDIRRISFNELSLSWIEGFDKFMSKTCKRNTRNIHLRNVRAMLNAAIDDERTTNYPFRKFRFIYDTTPKRSLTAEELVMLRDYKCEPSQQSSRDMFMLIFYLIGINAVDLYGLTEIKNGRIEYKRAKTHKLYSIKVEPEAMEIIDRYKGNTHLLYIGDKYARYWDFLRRTNDVLQTIGKVTYTRLKGEHKHYTKRTFEPIFPEITTYWARHTWATIAHRIGIDKDTISLALGHSFGCRVTDTYINYDSSRIDAANRKVIDYINQLNLQNDESHIR